jgi:hypothetical protein
VKIRIIKQNKSKKGKRVTRATIREAVTEASGP